MRRLRTITTRRLLGVAIGVVVLIAGAGIAQAALSGGGPKPQPKPLATALHDGLAQAPAVKGVTANIKFSNHLISQGALPQGTSSPLMSGADGRLWITNDGRFRIELQSQAGDAQIVSDGKVVTIYDASQNTAYRIALPRDASPQTPKSSEAPPTLAQIQRTLTQIGNQWNLSSARPGNTAGQPSYTVRITPKGDGGLLGAAELAWDANHGTPLRAAIYAQGESKPVLELAATGISYGSISASDVDVAPPAGAKIQDLVPQSASAGSATGPDRHGKQVTGLRAVQAQLPFTLAAPDTLAGLPRQQVWLAGSKQHASAVVTYGKGLGGIAVIESQAKPSSQGGTPSKGSNMGLPLPSININGATGQELSTALGTGVTFEKGGIDYVVVGSVPAQAAETAARELG
jgi:outer membrane lipoprotein-sorting protein